MNFLDDKDGSGPGGSGGGDRPFYSIQPKAFEEAFRKLSEEYQRLVVLAALGKQARFLAQQFSICCLLTSLDARKKMERTLTREEQEYLESEERLLAELYRNPTQKPN